MNQVRDIKQQCFNDVENLLWTQETWDIPEIKEIFYSINKLGYKDKPDYAFIKEKLN